LNSKKIGIGFLVLLVAGASLYGYSIYKDIFSANTAFQEPKIILHIPSGATYSDVETILEPYIKNKDRFYFVARKKKYVFQVKPGQFILKKNMNSNDIVNALKYNVPVKLSFNNQETLNKLAGRISQQIEADSVSLMKAFSDPHFLQENGFTDDTALSIFIPNTYEILWNTSAQQFRDKMLKEYHRFWNQERIQRADSLGLTPTEISILAAIVQKETAKVDERPKVAAVYLNRLRKGIKLQADPTVVYAIKKEHQDFDLVIKRVWGRDTQLDSPYNTYLYAGLPLGLITMPDISAIDAVLYPEQNEYIYFCASVTRFGYHEFASTLNEHNVNRKKYIQWINKQGIQR